MSNLFAPQYHDEEAARAHIEAIMWPNGPVCPHCGSNEVTRLRPMSDAKTHARPGTFQCRTCRNQFTVTVGTIFEDSKVPLNKWLLAIHLMCSSKKGISAHQLWRNLWGVDEETGKPLGSYRTAWFMAHRIRWALGQEPIASKLKGIVEVDETYVGGKIRFPQNPEPGIRKGLQKGQNPRSNKTPVVAILERGGDVRSFSTDRVTSGALKPVVQEMVEDKAILMTDSSTALKFQRKMGVSTTSSTTRSANMCGMRKGSRSLRTPSKATSAS